jgi:hypothetical protein
LKSLIENFEIFRRARIMTVSMVHGVLHALGLDFLLSLFGTSFREGQSFFLANYFHEMVRWSKLTPEVKPRRRRMLAPKNGEKKRDGKMKKEKKKRPIGTPFKNV